MTQTEALASVIFSFPAVVSFLKGESTKAAKYLYYISQLVRALWLVNLARRILLYGPLKFKAVFIAKMFRDLSPSVLNFFNK